MTATILLVDDTPANLSVLVDCLSGTGHRLMVAEDGEDAIAQATRTLPDLILLDVMMPGLDGFATCQRLKENPATRGIPVIFMTALTETAEKVRAFTAGAVDYITKPIQHEEVLARITTHLTLRQLRQEVETQLAKTERFMRIASHDLRNPLCLILMSGELSRRKPMPPEIAQYMENIHASAVQMRRIIDTFLNVRRPDDVTNGTPRTAHLNVIASAVAGQNEPAIERKEAILELQLDDSLPAAACDAIHAYQALMNYVSNALKFLPVGGSVKISTRARDLRIRVEVADSGPGIPPSERPELFKEFAHLSNKPTAGEESTGLGLSIVKQLVEANAGSVGADFPESGGSVFWFELPMAPGP